ncbi:unnamed protein product [Bursaphelenchus xylophilus]|uniref:(pine wood nematode) hypothetical protein n=1 Tax=Bursaphelenchus xylophilus TaxID=6326 RepID=A0A1I7S680_BURXY|nr:unnamed protein product [Bursaphelenchus xylophilus]CAG9081099.1 unnamed protein product [Bursaphelenchus xylophilus]
MTLVFSVLCFSIAFAPSLAIFIKLVTHDALRVILFFLGSFFWLLSILLSGAIAFVLPSIVPAVFLSALIQESARAGYFLLLHRAQRSLAEVATGRFSSLKTSLAHRHVLAVVCGLGFGVTAALFLLVNVLADYSGHGVVGLPASVPEIAKNLPIKLTNEDAGFPLSYSLSNSILVLDHIAWNIVLWDACHNRANRLSRNWMVGAACPVILHLINNAISLAPDHLRVFIILSQALVLLLSSAHAYLVVKKPVQFRGLATFLGVAVAPEMHSD